MLFYCLENLFGRCCQDLDVDNNKKITLACYIPTWIFTFFFASAVQVVYSLSVESDTIQIHWLVPVLLWVVCALMFLAPFSRYMWYICRQTKQTYDLIIIQEEEKKTDDHMENVDIIDDKPVSIFTLDDLEEEITEITEIQEEEKDRKVVVLTRKPDIIIDMSGTRNIKND